MILFLLGLTISGDEGLNHWWREGYGDYTENRFSINVAEKGIGVRLFSLLYMTPYAGDVRSWFWPAFEGKYRHLNFKVGCYHHTALEGLLLRMNQNNDFRIYRWMKGVYLKTDIKNLQITGFWGTPENVNFNDFSYNIVNDTTHLLMGLDGVFRLKPVKVTGGYIRLRDKGDLSAEAFTEMYGIGMDISLSIFEIFMNYIKKDGCRPVVGGRYSGEGYFGGLGFYLPLVSFQVFYEKYDSIGFGEGIYRYNDPPTITRSEYSINRGMDERGLGLNGNLSFGDYYIELNLARIQTHDEFKVVEDHGLKIQKGDITFDYEYLYFRRFEPEVINKVEQRTYLEWDYTFILPLQSIVRFNPVKADTMRYYEYGYEMSGTIGDLSITGSYERRTKRVSYLEDRTKWKKLELRWDRGNGFIMGIMLGEEKGGLVCSGGVCRWETPFRGVRFFLSKKI